jgi:uncharacterized protein YjbJ (UPF0337 family)
LGGPARARGPRVERPRPNRRLSDRGLGKIQESVGKAVGSTNQQVKGTIKKHVGATQAKFGDMKSQVKDANNEADKER